MFDIILNLSQFTDSSFIAYAYMYKKASELIIYIPTIYIHIFALLQNISVNKYDKNILEICMPCDCKWFRQIFDQNKGKILKETWRTTNNRLVYH